MDSPSSAGGWPALPYDAWRETRDTLHMMTQVVGKVRLALTPLANHWWNVTLYLTARGLTTSPMPYQGRFVEIAFDLVAHEVAITTDDGRRVALPLASRPVRDFHRDLLAALASLGVHVRIWRMPVEVPDPIPFDEDTVHHTYDPMYAHRFLRALQLTAGVLHEVRGRFLGKASPVHFFWGSFDLALTFFSGRRAPERPGADAITREAYSHEVISFGFWPGSPPVTRAAFFAYAAPTPAGLAQAAIEPAAAYWHTQLGEFLLDYDAVRTAPDPGAALRRFCESFYDQAAALARWDRAALERAAG